MKRTAVVTGGSRGIGYCVAQQLLENGFDVVITGRNETSLRNAQRELGALGNVATLAFDASDSPVASRLLSGVRADVLVANVGIGFSGTATKTTVREWEMVLENNVTSAFVAIKAVLEGMLEQKWGRIITVGSMASHIPIRGGVAYVTSKHALLGLTRAVALDTKGTGVTVNMVAPSFVRTDMTTENVERIVAASGLSSDVAEQKLAALSPLNRLLEPEEVATEIMRFVLDETGERSGTSVTMGFDVETEDRR